MNSTKVKTALSDLVRNGITGFFSGSLLFIPSYLLTSALFQYIFFDVLHKRHYSNGDDILLIYLCFPIAVVVSFLLGTLGGYWSVRIKNTRRAGTIGSIIGGGIGGLLIAGWMAYEIVHGWATYYD